MRSIHGPHENRRIGFLTFRDRDFLAVEGKSNGLVVGNKVVLKMRCRCGQIRGDSGRACPVMASRERARVRVWRVSHFGNERENFEMVPFVNS